MRLIELEPEFLRITGEGTFTRDATINDDGLMFLCPVCFVNNGNSNVGTHRVICWTPKVPQTIQPTPGRWGMQGTGFDDLTLVAGSSSVRLIGGCNAHFFIQKGAIVMC